MVQLYVAANSVVGANGHLQIVYDDGSGTLVETEVQSPNITTLGNWDFRPFGQPHNAFEENYGILPVTLVEEQSAEYVWELLGQVRESLIQNGSDLDYIVLTQNSNSYVRTLLYVIGNDSDWSNSFADDGLTDFSGWGRNVLFEAEMGWTVTNGIALNLAGTAGNDIIRTGNGDDILAGQAGNDTICSGAGNDTILAGEGDDYICGGDGHDSLSGDEGNDTIDGGGGNDTIDGGGGDDLLYGGGGNDLLGDGQGSDVILGGAGDDSISASIDYVAEEEVPPEEFVFVDGPIEVTSDGKVFGYDILDGGIGYDTVEAASTLYFDGSNQLMQAFLGEVTDVLLNFEVVSGTHTLDLSASDEGFVYEGGAKLEIGETEVEFPDLTRLRTH